MKSHVATGLVLTVFLVGCDVAGCGEEPRRDVDYGEGEGLEVGSMIYGVYQLFAASGYPAEIGPEYTLPYIEQPVRGIRINGSPVYFFSFDDEDEAEAFRQSVGRDGTSVGGKRISGEKPPHFYRTGKVFVLYLGEKESTITILTEVLGDQFAGA